MANTIVQHICIFCSTEKGYSLYNNSLNKGIFTH